MAGILGIGVHGIMKNRKDHPSQHRQIQAEQRTGNSLPAAEPARPSERLREIHDIKSANHLPFGKQ
jgi:hypothetical protein